MIKITNNTFSGCKTAVSAPADVELLFDGNRLIDCAQGVEIREPATLLGSLGLSPDTPLDTLAELIVTLRDAPHEELDQIAQAVESSGLSRFLGNAANTATLGTALNQIAQSPAVDQVLRLLTGG